MQKENSVDPDQLASEKQVDLDIHCFHNRIFLGSVGQGLLILPCNIEAHSNLGVVLLNFGPSMF